MKYVLLCTVMWLMFSHVLISLMSNKVIVNLELLVLVSGSSYTPHDSYCDYTPDASFSEMIFLHASLLVLTRSSSYTPDATFSEEFLLDS